MGAAHRGDRRTIAVARQLKVQLVYPPSSWLPCYGRPGWQPGALPHLPRFKLGPITDTRAGNERPQWYGIDKAVRTGSIEARHNVMEKQANKDEFEEK